MSSSFLGLAVVGSARRRRQAGGAGGGLPRRGVLGRDYQQGEGSLCRHPGSLAAGAVQGLQGMAVLWGLGDFVA